MHVYLSRKGKGQENKEYLANPNNRHHHYQCLHGTPKDKEKSKKCSPQDDLLTVISAIKSIVEALRSEVRKKNSDNDQAYPGRSGQRDEDHPFLQAASRTRGSTI